MCQPVPAKSDINQGFAKRQIEETVRRGLAFWQLQSWLADSFDCCLGADRAIGVMAYEHRHKI